MKQLYEVYSPFCKFLTSCLVERNLEKTIELVCFDVYVVESGKKVQIENREEFYESLKEEIKQNPNPMPFKISHYREKKLSEEIYNCFCNLSIEIPMEEKVAPPLHFVVTGTFRMEEGIYKVSDLHISWLEKEELKKLASLRDAQERKQFSKRKLINILMKMSPCGLMVTYVEKGFPLYCINQELLSDLGYTYEQFIKETDGKIVNIIHPDDLKHVEEVTSIGGMTKKAYDLDYRLKCKDGTYIWVSEKGKQISLEENKKVYIGSVIDISENMKLKRKLEREASVDSLTGIYNRRKAMELITKQEREKVPAALLMIDIDNFKKVNDQYGHQHGDEVLKGLAEILKRNTREYDIVSRFGGDEFLVYLYNTTDQKALHNRVEQLKQAFYEKYSKKYPDCDLGISIGMIYMEDNQVPFHILYTEVDQALYHVKNNGKSGVHFIRFQNEKEKENRIQME